MRRSVNSRKFEGAKDAGRLQPKGTVGGSSAAFSDDATAQLTGRKGPSAPSKIQVWNVVSPNLSAAAETEP
jgi:hypothetical protein